MEIRIDKLRLQVSGLTPEAARQLAHLLAQQLAATPPLTPSAPADAGFISVRVSVPPGQRPATLAAAAAAEISRALRRPPAAATAAQTPEAPTPGAPAPAPMTQRRGGR